MREPGGDDHVALSTATIFEDAVYLSEALSLPVDQTEDDIDAELVLLAQESGIQDPDQFLYPPLDISRALSTVTLDSDHRSSISVHSQETQSTSVTSAPSRTSRDQIYRSERSPPQRMPPRPARASLTIEHPTLAINALASDAKETPSRSTSSVSGPILSSSSSSTGPAPRRKRGSGLFNMFRKDSSSCMSQSHHGYSKGRRLKLECGHSLSSSAIRVHIEEARQRCGQSAPSCCGIALPKEALETVMAKEEAELVINQRVPSPDTESARDSGYCEKGVSSVDLPSLPVLPLQPATSASLPLIPRRRRHEAISIDAALATESFKIFRVQEKEQFEQVAAFECNQRKALSAYHTFSLKQLAAQHKTRKDEKMEQHTQDLEHLEELQIMAEHDLRKAQEVETQNVATALKHMEKYCLGSGQSHPDHPHIVTQEDFKKLDRQRMLQQSLPRRQENAINVLRARQERETKNRVRKQGAELDSMDATHERERAAEESEHAKEAEKLETVIETRRRRLLQRWDLKFEMWRRAWEEQHGTTVTVPLEHETWPLQATTTMTPIPESSSLSHYVQAVA
ncbi:hypothetical protein CC86DRAFT_299039 [Ophiobolus disseminans]|uniref:Uncharacterized protein n=1 Tax=Ophiobolus disseminans TaxID=1469910 RepID=A0A6A6ZTF0_9PLEO|nr:hypothetical protein CC86DRAFT_299039 [Ophiobolus disseminans]